MRCLILMGLLHFVPSLAPADNTQHAIDRSLPLFQQSAETGQALVALHRAGAIAASEEVYQRGVAYLLKGQLDDGSWLVNARGKPIQTYSESGFRHAKSQFISICRTCWATMALVLASDRKRAMTAD